MTTLSNLAGSIALVLAIILFTRWIFPGLTTIGTLLVVWGILTLIGAVCNYLEGKR